MRRWSLLFVTLALLAGIVGFSGLFDSLTEAARVAFFAFLMLFMISLVMALLRGSKS